MGATAAFILAVTSDMHEVQKARKVRACTSASNGGPFHEWPGLGRLCSPAFMGNEVMAMKSSLLTATSHYFLESAFWGRCDAERSSKLFTGCIHSSLQVQVCNSPLYIALSEAKYHYE